MSLSDAGLVERGAMRNEGLHGIRVTRGGAGRGAVWGLERPVPLERT